MNISIEEFRLIATGWAILIVFLTIFWYATLRRLSVILKERLESTRSHQTVSGMGGLLNFLLRGEYDRTGDQKLIGVCRKLRKLLYGYLGAVGAYVVFMIYCRPHL